MTGCTLDEDPGLFYPQVMQGQRDANIYGVYGQDIVSGTVDGPLFPSNGIQLLVYAIGTDAVTGTVAPYTHTITQANSLASMTVEKNLGDKQSQQFFGCRINQLTLSGQATNTEATISADVVGQGMAVLDTPTAITVTNEDPFVFAEATVSLLGTAIATVSSVSVVIANGLVSTFTMNGTHYLEYLTPVTLAVTGTIDVVWDSLDDPTYGWYTKMISQTKGAISFTLTHPSSGGSVEISLPSCRLSKDTIAPSMTGIITETLSFTAEYSQTSGYTIQGVVENSVQTAY